LVIYIAPKPLTNTLKKPFTLLLILSHLNAFVLGGVSNVYAANQVVDANQVVVIKSTPFAVASIYVVGLLVASTT
jgi:hypothetical protein